VAVIYKIVNVRRDRIYVGHTSNLFKTRVYGHRYALKRNKHENARLQHAWNKYGIDAFRFEVLEQCDESQKLIREQFYIDTLKPYYNVAPVAGSRKGVPQKPHVGEAVRRANLARTHEKPAGFGATMSKAVKGKPRSAAQRAATLRSLKLARQNNRVNKPGMNWRLLRQSEGQGNLFE
jgi:group I intron endonuclease